MNKTKIEWCDYTINPIKGLCPMACSYCYARRMYKRFKWNPEIRFEPIGDADLPKKPSHIFIGSTMELFGGWNLWMDEIISLCRRTPEHTFIFLTKLPENLIKWSPFPENCWVGVSATVPEQIRLAFKHLHYDVKATVKFVSFEPMLGMILPFREEYFMESGVNWIIIGAQTPYSPKTAPREYWVKELVEVADRACVPVFLKDNIKPVLRNKEGWTPALYVNARDTNGFEYLRQEFPELK